MDSQDSLQQLLQSLRVYLEELQDTGVDGLPLMDVPGNDPACRTVPPAVRLQDDSAPDKNIASPAAGNNAEEAVAPAETVAIKTETLESVRADLENCRLCSLGESRTRLVFGAGNPRARLVFVGEAPGRDEDLQGIPFVGKAGELLTSMIQRMGLTRDDVFICNVLKCRPPGNRNPLPEEIETCSPFLLRQLRAIGPEVVVALGTFAAQTLLNTTEPISKLRGRFHDYHGIPLMPTFHPSFLLRNGPEMRWTVWEDMVQVLEKMGMPVPDIRRKK